MIEARELRIGNKYNLFLGISDDGPKYRQVEISGIDTNILGAPRIKINNYNYWHPVENFEPIPLTEQWIKDLGLIKVIGWDDMVFWRLKEDEDSNNWNCFELIETLQGYELPSGKICEFVHQLQNCYFFHELTRKELTLNK